MHGGDLRAVARNPDEAHQSVGARLYQRVKCPTRTERGLPLFFVDQVVQLDEIKPVNLKSFERPMQTIARAVIGAVSGFGGEEEVFAVLAHPRTDAKLRIAIGRGRVDMVDAELEQNIQDGVGLVLLHPAQSGGAENHTRALMTGVSERNFLDHFPPRELREVRFVLSRSPSDPKTTFRER